MAQQKKIKNHIKADHILKKFWKDNSRFADLFNACMFDGEQVLKPNFFNLMGMQKQYRKS